MDRQWSSVTSTRVRRAVREAPGSMRYVKTPDILFMAERIEMLKGSDLAESRRTIGYSYDRANERRKVAFRVANAISGGDIPVPAHGGFPGRISWTSCCGHSLW